MQRACCAAQGEAGEPISCGALQPFYPILHGRAHSAARVRQRESVACASAAAPVASRGLRVSSQTAFCERHRVQQRDIRRCSTQGEGRTASPRLARHLPPQARGDDVSHQATSRIGLVTREEIDDRVQMTARLQMHSGGREERGNRRNWQADSHVAHPSWKREGAGGARVIRGGAKYLERPASRPAPITPYSSRRTMSREGRCHDRASPVIEW